MKLSKSHKSKSDIISSQDLKLSSLQKATLTKWRLILGKKSEEQGIMMDMAALSAHMKEKDKERGDGKQSDLGGAARLSDIDLTLNFVYSTSKIKRGAGLGKSQLTIPKWLENVKKLFPKKAKEVLEKD